MQALKVATFNVHHCAGLDGRIDIPRTAQVIRETGAEIVALQELDRGMKRSGAVDQPSELARQLDMHVGFHPTLERGAGAYGIGIVSRESIEWEGRLLPRLSEEEPRAVIVTRHPELTLIAVHLSLQPGPRATQTEAVAALAAEIEGPLVVLGDFNQPRRTLIPLFEAGLMSPRWPRKTLVRRFAQRDHILAGGGARVGRRRVIRTRASDHNALSAVVYL